tara:strand:+ start:286 stop:483 length:198 start_codon:yes stop_codon:yes gene_type:complete
MTYKELKDILNGLSDTQLDRNAQVWSTEDKEFYDVEYNHCGNIELLEASKSIIPTYDADTTYFVI